MKTFTFFSAIALVVIIIACNKKDDDTITPTETPRNVTYKIACTDCYVVYYKADGTEGTAQHVNSSWTYSFEGKKDSTVLLVAQNTSGTPAGVAATIILNSDTLQHHEVWCPISGTVFVVDTLQ